MANHQHVPCETAQTRKDQFDEDGGDKASLGRIGVRHIQAVILFSGISLAYVLRVNLSVGIVAMVDNSTESGSQTVDWTTAERGTVLGSFFWGYVITQVPGGQLSARIGAAKPLAISMIINGISTLFLPVVAVYGGFLATCLIRFILGLGQGILYPSVSTVLSKWTVPSERGRLYTFIFGGAQLGTIITLSGGGLLAGTAGWPSVFYVSGVLGIIWGIVCFRFIADSPEKHRTISKQERMLIEKSLISTADSSVKLKTPWLKMAYSGPLWALLLCHAAHNWGFSTLLTLMPSFISGVFHFDIKKLTGARHIDFIQSRTIQSSRGLAGGVLSAEALYLNGFLSALPYLVMWLASFLFSFIADYLIKRKVFSPAVSRKFWNSVALYGGAVALGLLAFLNTDSTGAIALLTVSVGLNSCAYLGYNLNHQDLSPNFAGTLMGITNCIANCCAFLGPTLGGFIVNEQDNLAQWRIVFLICAAIYVIGQTIFNIFGSGEVQTWNSSCDFSDVEKSKENTQNTRDT